MEMINEIRTIWEKSEPRQIAINAWEGGDRGERWAKFEEPFFCLWINGEAQE